MKQRRDSLGLNIEEIESHIHIRHHYLSAIEEGQFELLPSFVQARGMLNNYAHFLDLDEEALLLEFAEGLQAQRLEKQAASANATPPSKAGPKHLLPASLRRLMSPDFIFGGGILIVLVIFAIWGTIRILNTNDSSSTQPAVAPISDVILSTSYPELLTITRAPNLDASKVALTSSITADTTLSISNGSPINLIVIANRSAWIRITVDNVIEFEGRTSTGVAYAYEGEKQIEIITGDGSATSIIYNQTNLGVLGDYGEVVNRIYTTSAILAPSPTNTPTPTITSSPTITPRPSNTLVSSSTPRPTASLNP